MQIYMLIYNICKIGMQDIANICCIWCTLIYVRYLLVTDTIIMMVLGNQTCDAFINHGYGLEDIETIIPYQII